MTKDKNYDWTYCSLGGVTRVKISKGEDIAHLGELDQKLWTVLSCPVSGLDFDSETLKMMDTDGDGKIRVPEVVGAAQWLTSAIKDKDLILKGDSVLPLAQIDTENEVGRKLYNSAAHILKNLGLEKEEISIADTADIKAIFAKAKANGDGIITVNSSDDAAVKATIENIIASFGSKVDRSGDPGVDKDMVEAFYAACNDFAQWNAAAKDDAAILPYGDDTAAALASCEAIASKVSDFFIRCRLVDYNVAYSESVDVAAEKVSAISEKNLSECRDEISQYPLAHPVKEGVLPFTGINPAWQAAFDCLKTHVLDVDFKGKDGITEDEWNAVVAKFGPYKAWFATKKGEAVEGLGLERVEAVIKEDLKPALLDIIEKDLACAEEVNTIEEVHKLLHLYRDFYKFLRNYVTFSDLYSPEPGCTAIFEEGKLYIDQRCCNLCIKVENMGNHGDMSALSGMFLLYCHCVSKSTNAEMDIVAVMTNGSTRNLRPGKNGIFYDLQGHDWDATITKIVENPISVKQAFWAPYVKFWNFCVGLINKSAEEKDAKSVADLQATATAPGAEKKGPFDIAKFAGIFAAIGMALGFLGSFLTKLVAGISSTPAWKILVIIAVIMLCISGPSCFIAWSKLRKRNLGPVLNANGWAINSVVLINILFGKHLTSVADYPIMRNVEDPYVDKKAKRRRTAAWIITLLIITFGVLFFTNHLAGIGLPFNRTCHRNAPSTEVVIDEALSVEEAADASPKL